MRSVIVMLVVFVALLGFTLAGCNTGDPAVDTTVKTDAKADAAKVDAKAADATKPAPDAAKPDTAKVDAKAADAAKTDK
jgi:outer membrane murein-binding lipoprotein Lpp